MTRQRKIGMALGGAMAAVAVTALTMTVAEAQQPPTNGYAVGARANQRGPGMGGNRGLVALGFRLGQLDLTDQQRQQIRGILQGQKEKARAFAVQGRAAGRQLRRAIADGADEPTIRAKAAEVAKVQADAAVFRARVRQEIVSVLTPEQQAKAKALRDKAVQRAERTARRKKVTASS